MDIASALKSSGIAPIDAETMLAFLLQRDRAYLLAHSNDVIDENQEKRWKQYVDRRKTGEPVAYIIGQREFYGRVFYVDRRVHIPRPSTENLVSMALDFLSDPKDEMRDLETGIIGTAKMLRDCSAIKTIVDVGTGSGCIAITMALERPDLRVIAIDISKDALDVAKENAERLGASVEFLLGDLLEPVRDLEQPFIVVSNPPYIPSRAKLENEVVEFEPALSLRSGRDGTVSLRKLTTLAELHPHCQGWIVECLSQQREEFR